MFRSLAVLKNSAVPVARAFQPVFLASMSSIAGIRLFRDFLTSERPGKYVSLRSPEPSIRS